MDIYQTNPINGIPISAIIKYGVYLPAKNTELKAVSLGNILYTRRFAPE